MVFPCRCFSFLLEDAEIEQDDEIESKSTTAAASNFSLPITNFHAKSSENCSNLSEIGYETSSVQTNSATTYYTASSGASSGSATTSYTPSSDSAIMFYTLDRNRPKPSNPSDFKGAELKTVAEASGLSSKCEPGNLRVFTVAELETATENFCAASKIGEGRSGTVYKGVIKSLEHPFDEIQVAVKASTIFLQVRNSHLCFLNMLPTEGEH